MIKNNFIEAQNAVYEEKLNQDIEVLNLSTKSYNALKSKNINTIGELLRLSKKELYNIRNLGNTGIEIIIISLRKLGLRFNFEMENQIPSTKEDYLYLRTEYLKGIKQKQDQIYKLQREIWELQSKVSEFESIISDTGLSEENNDSLHM